MTRRRKRPPAPLLSFDEVTKEYGEVLALGPVSLEVGYGQLVALLGHNGSGKSTLLAAAAGVLEPTEGEVKIAGAKAGDMAARAAVTYVRDRPVLYEDLSLSEHLEYLARLHGSDPEAHDSRALVENLGMAKHADEVPSTFSRGMRQKASIAVAMCRPFALMLIDEPFSGLDQQGKDAFIDLITGVRGQNGSVLVATHTFEALDVFDRVVILDEGTLVYDGPPDGAPI